MILTDATHENLVYCSYQIETLCNIHTTVKIYYELHISRRRNIINFKGGVEIGTPLPQKELYCTKLNLIL